MLSILLLLRGVEIVVNLRTYRIRVPRVYDDEIKVLDSSGIATRDYSFKTLNDQVEITIPKGTKATLNGAPVEKITVDVRRAINGQLIYDLGPDGAEFEPYLVFSVYWKDIEFKNGLSYADMGIGQWMDENTYSPIVASNARYGSFSTGSGFIVPEIVKNGERVPLIYHDTYLKSTSIPVKHFSDFTFGSVKTGDGEVVDFVVDFNVGGDLKCN